MFVLFAIALFSFESQSLFASQGSQTLKVWFFAIGQGDAIFLELPTGEQMLIDGGPDDSVLSKIGSVMPPWDRSIDVLVATHPDADHITGLVSVLEHDFALTWGMLALIIAGIAQGKNRSGFAWFLLGSIFGPFALFLVVLFEKIKDEPTSPT